MVLKKLISLLLLLTLQCSHTCYGQCTTFQFIGQPPANLNCIPFDTRVNPAVWRLRVLCTAERLTGSDEFEVHWFQRYINNTIENLARPEFRSSGITFETTYFGGHLLNDEFSDNMLGDYWCQVIVNGMPTGVYSDGFTILRPEEYDDQLNTCSGVLFDNSISVCENQPPNSPPTITTSMSVVMATTNQLLSPSLSGPVGMMLSETLPVATSPSHTVEVEESPSPKIVNTMITRIPVTLTSTIVTLSSVPSIPINILPSPSVPISSTSIESDDSGLTSFYIVIIIATTIIIMMLGILLVILCLVILFIKRKKKIEERIYYVTPEVIKSPDPCNQLKTSTAVEPVEYLTILDESSNITRTPVNDNSHYYSVINKEIVTTQEEKYQSLDCTKLTSDNNYTTLITTQEERYQSLDCTKLTSDSNYTTLM